MSKASMIILHKGKHQSVLRQHPWVFSGAVHHIEGDPAEGDLVAVHASSGKCLGWGHYQQGGSIRVRMLSFQDKAPGKAFWKQKIASAWQLRKAAGLTGRSDLNAFRLVFAEGDGLPGLVADYYDGTVVMQCHTAGMYLQRETLAVAFRQALGDGLKAVYDKSADTLHEVSGIKAENTYLLGESQGSILIREHGHEFLVDFEQGQKTGFFLDQRDNRQLLANYVQGKSVLNTFSYTGGFSVYAASAGARSVHSVDSSRPAIQLLEQNMGLNGYQGDPYTAEVGDVFEHLKQLPDNAVDVIVLDPPAFAKGLKARHNALMAYKRLNLLAMKKLKSHGILFTFSCSQVVTADLFEGTVTAAGIESGQSFSILHRLAQPADHPVGLYHPEGRYLKGLVLFRLS
jgi:23S rRNA (cytosine1962-C5)-methyltransferase